MIMHPVDFVNGSFSHAHKNTFILSFSLKLLISHFVLVWVFSLCELHQLLRSNGRLFPADKSMKCCGLEPREKSPPAKTALWPTEHTTTTQDALLNLLLAHTLRSHTGQQKGCSLGEIVAALTLVQMAGTEWIIFHPCSRVHR